MVGIDLAKEAEFELAGVRVRPALRQIEARIVSETLEPRVMQVLVALARRRDEVVTRDDLITSCWEGRVVGEDAINRCISKVRRLGELHGAFRLETIPRVGYRLTVIGEDAGATRARGDAPSLAVLPFTNRSTLPEDEVFADGMVEDIIAALSQGVFVRVLGSIVTAQFKNAQVTDLAAVGRQLGVRYLLEGNVRRAGENLRVTTQLLEAETGAVAWSGRFDRPLSDLAALQEELVIEVAGVLDAQVQMLETRKALQKPHDLTAWEAVIRSTAEFRSPDSMAPLRALEAARRAVEIAPDYAPGLAQLAAASGILYFYVSPDDDAEVRRIRDLADRALNLAPDDPFTLGTAGGALTTIGLAEEALVPLRRALEKSPGVGGAHFSMGWTLCTLGRCDEAMQHLDDAWRLMPVAFMHGHIHVWKANVLIRLGRYEEAERVCDEVLNVHSEYDTARAIKAALCWRDGRFEEARAIIAPVPSRGTPLSSALNLFRRAYAGSPAADMLMANVRALWPAP